uniref:Ankyrin repeat-containing protein n=1 Tax=Borely moumouvirus TaxID=2712067 RepID=A0A6G6ACT6_9VIRU
MSSKLYFKITNELECHHGFQYVDGLNILKEEFNNNPKASCVPGRLYFSDSINICKFLHFGINLREVTLPTDNPDFQMIKDPEGDKYGANMIILGKKRDLRDIDTWEYLISVGINIRADYDFPLRWASYDGHLEIVRYLVEKGANIHVCNNEAIMMASENGHLGIVKYLLEKGANIHVKNDYALILACSTGHLEVVKYLVEKGADIHAYNNKAIRWASRNGFLEVVKYLVENGADINAKNNYALKWAANNKHLEVIIFLIEKGANINTKDYNTSILRFIKEYLEYKNLLEEGANIYADKEYAMRRILENAHTKIVSYFSNF